MNLSLDYLEAFVTAAEEGSFTKAARQLNKAQSAVSTAISNLEIDLGVELFSRASKYPQLTEEGEILLREAKNILMRTAQFYDRANSFAAGAEPQIRIALDEIIPHHFLVDMLTRFGELFPTTEVEILYGSLSDIEILVEKGRADMGLLAPFNFPGKEITSKLTSYISFHVVVSPDHPLATKERITPADLEPYRQLCITSRGGEGEPKSLAHGKTRWMIESTPMIHQLLYRGAGFSLMPIHFIREDLETGRLVKLNFNDDQVPYKGRVYFIRSAARPLGKGGQWLANELTAIAMDFE